MNIMVVRETVTPKKMVFNEWCGLVDFDASNAASILRSSNCIHSDSPWGLIRKFIKRYFSVVLFNKWTKGFVNTGFHMNADEIAFHEEVIARIISVGNLNDISNCLYYGAVMGTRNQIDDRMRDFVGLAVASCLEVHVFDLSAVSHTIESINTFLTKKMQAAWPRFQSALQSGGIIDPYRLR